MHIISLKALRLFWQVHPAAESPLRHWHTLVEQSGLGSFQQVREIFGSADYVAPFTVFDIGGNNYRLATIIHYNTGKVFRALL
jgi:mRNA interferase HigB